MNNNDDDHPDMTTRSRSDQQPGFDSDDFGGNPAKEPRREPVFSGFDEAEDDGYEEPDRDTDYTSGYHPDSADEAFDDNLLAEDDVILEEEASLEEEAPRDDWEEHEEEDILWSEPVPTGAGVDSELDEQDLWDAAAEQEPGQDQYDVSASNEDDVDDDDWPDDAEDSSQDDNEWVNEEEYPQEDDGDMRSLPLGLIIVAIVALLLLAAGGYGVMQQRTATQEEIRQLRASLATAASPAEVSAGREALRDMETRNSELATTVEALTLENRRLADTVTGLESQLAAQQAAMAKQATQQADKVAPAKKPAPAKPAAPQPATPKPATPQAAAAGTGWFVNFGSYSQRIAAQNWAGKLQPGAGKVVVASGSKEGQTFYRVRVIELSSKESAEKIARQLEREYGLSKLWIGQQ